jgi:hypothetical protein
MRKHSYCGKAILCYILYILRAKHMRRILFVYLSLPCPALPYFYILSEKCNDFRKKIIDRMYVFDILLFFTYARS